MKFHLTQAIFLLRILALTAAHPYQPFVARERIPPTTIPNPPSLPVPEFPSSPINPAPPSKPLTPSTPPTALCGQTLTFNLFTHTHSTPPFLHTLLVTGPLEENGKQICSISTLADPLSHQEKKMVCEEGYSASFSFKRLSGKLGKDGKEGDLRGIGKGEGDGGRGGM